MSKATKLPGSRSSKRPTTRDPRKRAEQILAALGESPTFNRALAALDRIAHLPRDSENATRDSAKEDHVFDYYARILDRKSPLSLVQHLKNSHYAEPPWVTAFVTRVTDIVHKKCEDLLLSTLRGLGLETAYFTLSGGGDSGSSELDDLIWCAHHPDGRPVVELSMNDLSMFPTHPYLCGSILAGAGHLLGSLDDLACEIPYIDWVNNEGGGGQVEIHPFELDDPFVDGVVEYEAEPDEDDEDDEDLEDEELEEERDLGADGEGRLDGDEDHEERVTDAPIQLEIDMPLPTFDSVDMGTPPLTSAIYSRR